MRPRSSRERDCRNVAALGPPFAAAAVWARRAQVHRRRRFDRRRSVRPAALWPGHGHAAARSVAAQWQRSQQCDRGPRLHAGPLPQRAYPGLWPVRRARRGAQSHAAAQCGSGESALSCKHSLDRPHRADEMSVEANMTDGEVRYVRDRKIATVIFDRPAARNAMTWRMYEQLGEACARIQGEDGLRAAVFRGAGGKAFIAGTDIAQFQAFASGEDGVAYEAKMEAYLAAIEALPVP